MFEYRHTLKVFLFVFICLFLTLFFLLSGWSHEGLLVSFKESEGEIVHSRESFDRIHYFLFEKGKPRFHLEADYLTFKQKGLSGNFLSSQGSLITREGRLIEYKGDRGVFKREENALYLQGQVSFRSQNSHLETDHLVYHFDSARAFATGNVKSHHRDEENGYQIELESHKASFRWRREEAEYFSRVRGSIKRDTLYGEKISFSSNKINFSGKRGKMSAQGGLVIKKQAFRAQGQRGEIFWASQRKKLKYFVLYDDVRVSEKVRQGSRQFERKSFCEKLEGFMNDSKIILTGYPKVFQHKDVVKGNQIILRKDNEVIEVDGANMSFNFKKKEEKEKP